MPERIHFIEKANLIRKVEGRVHESGYWDIKPETAAELVGKDIYFHKKQKEPSFFGGKILDYKLETAGEYIGRIIFRFEFTPAHRNVSAGSEGWSYEKKIV